MNRILRAMTIRRGDVFRHELAGAGGWGDPLERDPQAVLRDVRNEMIGRDCARRDYGVIVEAEAWRFDESATAALRDRLAAARGWRTVPKVLLTDDPARAVD